MNNIVNNKQLWSIFQMANFLAELLFEWKYYLSKCYNFSKYLRFSSVFWLVDTVVTWLKMRLWDMLGHTAEVMGSHLLSSLTVFKKFSWDLAWNEMCDSSVSTQSPESDRITSPASPVNICVLSLHGGSLQLELWMESPEAAKKENKQALYCGCVQVGGGGAAHVEIIDSWLPTDMRHYEFVCQSLCSKFFHAPQVFDSLHSFLLETSRFCVARVGRGCM